MSRPLVSIIVPCYKQACFLPATLYFVLDQTYENWECIVVNDGAPDNTSEVAENFISEDSRFVLLEQENQGLAMARNNGIRKSHGEFILPLDSDDFGWYRFGINESVKPSVIQDTIKCNYYFLRWLYKQSLFNRIWAIILGKGQISTLVDQNNKGRKIYCNFVLPKEMDSFITEYGNHRIGRFFFLSCQKSCSCFF